MSKGSSRAREREAERARENRLEIVKALSTGEVLRRDLYKWGIFTLAGTLAFKNGLSPFAPSAFAAVPTGTPRSPLFGATKFSQPMPRLALQNPSPITRAANGDALFPAAMNERPAKRLSYHSNFSANPTDPQFINPLTGRGPIEGRPPGEFFAHQRWDEFFPKAGYVMSLAQVASGTRFHPLFPAQNPESVWTWASGNVPNGKLPPFLIKARYGEPILLRAYNNLPADRAINGGFGRNETQFHFHNAHNGAESDGAANVHHFPGTFYDYRWSLALARRDKINTAATDKKASAPNGAGGLVNVPGDFREIQSSLWAHDHRFFFTAENVYKGNVGCVNIYSGPDRGNEKIADGVNLRLPSGSLLDWGNTDFDVNLMISDQAYKADGQLYFDIFDTDGFLGDVPMVNMAFAPFFEVLPRKYRFRILNCCQSRFINLVLANAQGAAVPIQVIAVDGNLLPKPVSVTALGDQATGERFDIVVDFSKFAIGQKLRVVNLNWHADGRQPKQTVSLAQALAGLPLDPDPMVGPILEFRIVSQVASVDVPGVAHSAFTPDTSVVPLALTQQIPLVTPVRTRVINIGRGTGTSRGANGQCTPDCPDAMPFPWVISVNGQPKHSLNANRVALVVPKPGEVEHWTVVNESGGWQHPMHLHFEEGVTFKRTGSPLSATENMARKDVWRVGNGGSVSFQVQFGEFAGAYITHCHNTMHEDFAMAARVQLISGITGAPQAAVTPTPNPTPDGVVFTTPEVMAGAL